MNMQATGQTRAASRAAWSPTEFSTPCSKAWGWAAGTVVLWALSYFSWHRMQAASAGA